MQVEILDTEREGVQFFFKLMNTIFGQNDVCNHKIHILLHVSS